MHNHGNCLSKFCVLIESYVSYVNLPLGPRLPLFRFPDACYFPETWVCSFQ
jgi:hypothetical protein